MLVEGGGTEFPAFYAEGVLEIGVELAGGEGLTVGGPAVATAGRGEEGKEGEEAEGFPGPELPEPDCVPWTVKLAHVRRVLSDA